MSELDQVKDILLDTLRLTMTPKELTNVIGPSNTLLDLTMAVQGEVRWAVGEIADLENELEGQR